ncbi:MAG TPA: CHAT domain-containing protein [Acidimicrobiia bacterium]|nr:CHAT domain-containing protein [Acidimicrobiia bacterium]
MSIREYTDFDVAIEAEGEEFVAKVLASPAGQATGRFTLPFSPIELENFVLKVGRTRSGVRKMGSPEGSAAEMFGKKLYETVFAGEVGICFRRSIDDAGLANRGLRVRIRTSDAPTLNNIPWEFVWAEGLGRFVALSNQTPVVRYIDLPTRIRPLAIAPPLRILLMVSNPTDVEALDVQREVDLLRDATEDLVSSRRVELVVMEDANMASLAQRLRREEFHIFHFIGHGGFVDGDGVLVLEDSSERARPVKGQHLGTIFHDHGSLRLAVLNACEGARASAEDPFSGVAPSLIRQGIPAVIAMQFEITDAAAIQFAHEFYLAVADGYPVDAAVTEARKGIFAADNDLEWATPVLYMRAPDGMIFDLTAPPVPIRGTPPPSDRPPPDPKPSAPTHVETDPVAAYEKALVAIDSRSWSEAVRHLQRVLELDPAHPHARAHLEDAERRVRASALIDEGRVAHGAGEWEEAVASFREAAELDPDITDEDGLLADAAWRVDVLRQPTEVVPESATVTPSAPTFESAPIPVNDQTPAPAPSPAVRPPAYQPRPKSKTGLIVALAVGIPVAIYLFLIILGLLVDDTPPTTTIQTGATQTTVLGIDPTTAPTFVVPPADITARRAISPPAINGDFTEWEGVASTLSTFEVFPRQATDSLPVGVWWVGWDEGNLYLYIDVADAALEQPWSAELYNLWRGDSANFEFGPDPTGLGSSSGLRSNDVHVLLGPNSPGQAPAITAINRVVGGDIVRGPDPAIEAVAVITDSGYVIEARIPWQELGVSNPAVGTVFGMNVNVSDVGEDFDGDGRRDLRVMVSNNPDRQQPFPGTWTTMVLGP